MSNFEHVVGTDIINGDIRAMREHIYAEPRMYEVSAEINGIAEALERLVGLQPAFKQMCRDEHLPFTGVRDFWDTDESAICPLLTRIAVDYVAPRTPDVVTDRYAVALSYGTLEEGIVLTNCYIVRRLQDRRATAHMRLATEGLNAKLEWTPIYLPGGQYTRATAYEVGFLGRELERLQALPAEQAGA